MNFISAQLEGIVTSELGWVQVNIDISSIASEAGSEVIQKGAPIVSYINSSTHQTQFLHALTTTNHPLSKHRHIQNSPRHQILSIAKAAMAATETNIQVEGKQCHLPLTKCN